MKVLVAIFSAHHLQERRIGVRATWLRRLLPYMQHRFYVGTGPALPGDEQADTTAVDAPDDWSHLALKVRAAYQHSLQFDYDWLFKIDDDAYFVPERFPLLFSSCQLAPVYPVLPGETRAPRNGEPCYIGSEVCQNEVYAAGGSGYILARRLVERLAKRDITPRFYNQEDGWVGMCCRDWTRLYTTPLLEHHCDRLWPTPSNQVVTCHMVRTVADMFKFHARYLCATPGVPRL